MKPKQAKILDSNSPFMRREQNSNYNSIKQVKKDFPKYYFKGNRTLPYCKEPFLTTCFWQGIS